MDNNLDLDLNLDPNLDPPSAPPNVTPPSNDQTPRRKRTRRTSNNESSSSSRPKPDPNAPLITEPCQVCGKKFWSSKALHGHMRSHPERQWRGINAPPNYQPTVPIPPPVSATAEGGQVLAIASATGSSVVGVEGRFECGGCKKVFESRQALDGHICSAILNLNEDPPPSPPPSPPPQQEIIVSGMNHRCDLCSKVFSSGQALGGHMRCHWAKDRKEKQQASSTGIDLNAPASSTNLPGSSSADPLPESSLDLGLRL